MKRRQLVRYASFGLLSALGTVLVPRAQRSKAQPAPGTLRVQWFGHTCFLFTGGGRRILVNPFRTIGCTAGYRPVRVEADLVMISSQLLDEGYLDTLQGNPRVLAEPGAYQLPGFQVQGIATDHDRLGGRRFGTNVVWRWQQAGINILHMGGAAAPVTTEQKILMGRPDILLIPVGGGPKAYRAEDAMQTIALLNPKMVIPTQYRTQAANPDACDIDTVESFVNLMKAKGADVRNVGGDSFSLKPQNLPNNGPIVRVMGYRFR